MQILIYGHCFLKSTREHESMLVDVCRAICRPEVASPNENDVEDRPHPQATETEEFSDGGAPVSQIESIHTKSTQRYAGEIRN